MFKDKRSLDTNITDHFTYLQYQQFINEFTGSKIKFPKKNLKVKYLKLKNLIKQARYLN